MPHEFYTTFHITFQIKTKFLASFLPKHAAKVRDYETMLQG